MRSLGEWVVILRLALVQAAVASVTVIPISTLPRLMVEELAFFALMPAGLIGVHYAVQTSRARFGFGSDVAHRRTPFVLGGLALLAVAAVGCAAATWLMASSPVLGYAAALVAYGAVGIGIGAAGTTLFALVSTMVSPERRAPAATAIFLTMIFGLVLTSKLAGGAMIPFSFAALLEVSATVSLAAGAIGTLAIWRLERAPVNPAGAPPSAGRPTFRAALAMSWHDPTVRGFTLFVFMSMFAYNMQELVMEPFSAAVFGLEPGASTRLSGDHHAGVFAGLVLMALAGWWARGRPAALVTATVAGCVGSALALGALATAALNAPDWPLRPTILAYGLANGLFAGGAVAAMFSLAGDGTAGREGTRIGLWGTAQALGFGLGMVFGAGALDAARALIPVSEAFASVFLVESALFLVAALVALRVLQIRPDARERTGIHG